MNRVGLCSLLVAWFGVVSYSFGVEVQREWPFYVPTDVVPPEVVEQTWVRNEVDRFVLHQLESAGLQPAEEASQRTLIRRLYFDLIGLPPTPAEVQAFLADDGDDAYARLVDRLLDDARYGERWARFWLDLARYADTAGYEGDPDLPHAWRYRDYVIDAFNTDKPYDLFIREQIAGDEFDEIMGAGELPQPSPEQIVAMTFLRLAPFTEPRGDETRHEMLSEMTSTVGSVFLGLTVGCAKCHDHKYDDIPTEDFYRLQAFFATVQIPPPERGDGYQIGGPIPAAFYRPNETDWAAKLRSRLQHDAETAAEKLTALKQRIAARMGKQSAGGTGFGIQAVTPQGNDYVFEKRAVHDGQIHWAVTRANSKQWSVATAGQSEPLGSLSGANRGQWFGDLSGPLHISLGQHTAGSGMPQGNAHMGAFAEVLSYDHPLTDDPIDQMLESGDSNLTWAERREYEFLSTRSRFVKQHLKRLLPVAMSLRHSFGPPYEAGVPTSRVMIRGEYDNPGAVVEPGFLSVITGNQDPAPIRLDPFKRWPTRSRRMALAQWIASPENPLTARVMVNRIWHRHFGQGIVRTPSDFGDLSGGPSHQALLDWLAVKFVEEQWSIKAIQRVILNSATYRQSSNRFDERSHDVDPDNRLLWRFNRQRLDAEAIRDSVLAVSGRLNSEQFGLPIFPPLPGDVAETVKYSESKWDTQYGDEGRKRSIYIYQQRTLTMPFMQTFDSLVCDESRPQRRASVTPLQALAMYNGEFVNEAARHFAVRLLHGHENDATAEQVEHAFMLALGRPPSESESELMVRLATQASTREEGMTAVCRVLFNASEFIYVD